MSYGFGVLNDYAEWCHKNSAAHGFWDSYTPHGRPERFLSVELMLSKLMLVTTEVAEAAEAVRHGNIDNFREELADVCIRVFDLAEATGTNLEQEICNKMAANEERPHMHGKRA